ncbi:MULTISPECIES: DUF1419 domain-containing protein [Rhizobium]|jgi:hypothetical protein|uniref:DUF1419 domain-containing protein n=1 Tax=Rhizobium TaxID=379 RepID=UPI00267BCC4E
MNPAPAIHKVFQGVADRHQMFRMFDRHSQLPNRWEGNATSLYAGEWFEIGETEHDYMFEILPPLWIRGSMFGPRTLKGHRYTGWLSFLVSRVLTTADHDFSERTLCP